ncbi:MAG: adenosine deaminase family protein [Planctomycetes bacterium]|nr:adenosine deaminase family protein [Planctomycetota bacterium]
MAGSGEKLDVSLKTYEHSSGVARSMLGDLHRHLDGSLRLSTLHELALPLGVEVPRDIRFKDGMGLAAALARFRVTLAVLQTPAAVRRVAREICEDAREEGVGVLEIRFAPQLHRGAPPEEILDAAIEGAAGRAGFVLCGLYGEPPEILLRLVEAARTRPGVVGIDLAGGPRPEDRWRIGDYAPAFARARDLGLGRTVHAGEGRPPCEIRRAIEVLNAQRIGHGTTLLDDPELTALVVEAGVVIEACPTSNVHTGVLARVEDHPLPRWLERGVRACVCPDNTLFSGVDAKTELERVSRIPGMTAERLHQVVECGVSAAFSRAGERS